jgi:hypothetical protein
MTTRQMVEPPSSMSRSIAGRSSPLSQLAEFALTPKPSMIWKRWLPSIARAVPAALLTVTERVETAVSPAASRAVALNWCPPLAVAVVVQATEYGAARSSAPSVLPSSLNCTPTTTKLSAAFALTVTLPETVAPLAGAVNETVGACVSAATLFTVTVRTPEVEVLPAASRATAVSECVALADVVESQVRP